MPRRWDVGHATAVAVACGTCLVACGQAQFAAPPPPEFTGGERAEPTVVTVETLGADVEPIVPEAVEADLAPIDVGQMVIVDDAGVAAPNAAGWERFDLDLEQRLIPANVSASVAVMVDGEMVHQGAYGRRVAGGSEAVDVSDRFRVASISKTITAITTLRLVEAGVLTLDEPVGDLLTEHLGLGAGDRDARSITVRELLSHTAGFPKHQSTFFANGASSCTEAASTGLARSVSGGSSFVYSNMSYCVLGVLLEAVTGKTYERVVDEQLLTPLGISGMRFTSTYELGPDEVSHHPSPGRTFMEALGAAGAWNATPTDLVMILDSVDPATPGWKALSPEMMSAMRYRVPTERAPAGYGLGVINYDGGAWGHTGTLQNTHAMVLAQPDGVTWAITVSGESPSESTRLRSIMRDALTVGFPAG